MSTLESTLVNFSVFSFLNLSRDSWMIQTQSCQSSSNGTKNLVLEATKKTCKVSPHKMVYNRSKWSYGASSPPPLEPEQTGCFGGLMLPDSQWLRRWPLGRSQNVNAASVRRSRALFLNYKFIGIYRVKQLHLQGI